MKQTLEYLYVNNFTGQPEQIPTLLSLSKMRNSTEQYIPPHIHSYCEMFYFESGSGVFECGGETIELVPHTVLVVNANVLHTQNSNNADEPLVYYNFAIDDIYLADRPKNEIHEKAYFLYHFDAADNSIRQKTEDIFNQLKEQPTFFALSLIGKFYDVFSDVLRLMTVINRKQSAKEQTDKELVSLHNAKKYIVNNYFKNIALDELARMSLMSPSNFLHKFTNYYRISPIQYLIRVRIENAKVLIMRSSDSISSIALTVGFNTPSYFSEVFKKYEGMTPKEFRQKNKSKG